MTEDVVALAEHLMSEREYQRAFEALDIAKKSHRCLEKCLLLYGTLSVKTGNYLEGLHYCKEVWKIAHQRQMSIYA
jgi:anti-sigma factor ChrR (cupin superfamily)